MLCNSILSLSLGSKPIKTFAIHFTYCYCTGMSVQHLLLQDCSMHIVNVRHPFDVRAPCVTSRIRNYIMRDIANIWPCTVSYRPKWVTQHVDTLTQSICSNYKSLLKPDLHNIINNIINNRFISTMQRIRFDIFYYIVC